MQSKIPAWSQRVWPALKAHWKHPIAHYVSFVTLPAGVKENFALKDYPMYSRPDRTPNRGQKARIASLIANHSVAARLFLAVGFFMELFVFVRLRDRRWALMVGGVDPSAEPLDPPWHVPQLPAEGAGGHSLLLEPCLISKTLSAGREEIWPLSPALPPSPHAVARGNIPPLACHGAGLEPLTVGDYHPRKLVRFRSIVLCLCCLAWLSQGSPSAMGQPTDDGVAARRSAHRVASGLGNDGFFTRDKVESDLLKPGERSLIPCQLLRGNIYWFVVGTEPPVPLELAVFDELGNRVTLTQQQEGGVTAIGMTPPWSGRFFLRIALDGERATTYTLLICYK
ncbi:MAG: hypothetical protein SNJ52_03510 [Verrucomicrobiia bacterium]